MPGQRTDLGRLLGGCLSLRLRLLLWRRHGRRRWWDGNCRTAGRCLRHLRRGGRVLPSSDRDTACDDGCRREPRNDRLHLLVS